MDDPSTAAVTEGFGLMFYVSRMYDPALGRFAQADSIVPPGVQGLDRYAYVGNSPVRYTDPSGHICVQGNGYNDEYAHSGACNGKSYVGPDEVDPSDLTTYSPDKIEYSGEMMYNLYLAAWRGAMRSTGNHLTIKQFIIYMLGHEFMPYGDSLSEEERALLKSTAGTWFWCSPNPFSETGCTNLRDHGGATNAALLNWIGAMQSARGRYDNWSNGADAWQEISTGVPNLSLATDVLNFVLFESSADGHLYMDLPFSWANASLPLYGIEDASQGRAYNQYWSMWGVGDSIYILTPCQSAFFTRDYSYLHDICGVDP
jgi:RHS repeat-associated protein